MTYKRTPIEQRFWKYVRKTATCWLWTGATTNGGYGVINGGGRGSKIVRAHRLSYEMHNGIAPGELDVCHVCDNPRCVNPAHLFLGTAAENVEDMIGKGRDLEGRKNRPRGEGHHQAKLTDEQVIAIRAEYAAGGTSLNKLAVKFNVSKRGVLNIVKGAVWKHLL